MKMEKLNSNKIRITLSSDEFEDWQINLDSLTYNSPEAQDFFWTIIRQAESELDFEVNDSHLMVEASMKDDSFTIIVSKVNDEHEKKPSPQKSTKTQKPKICKTPKIVGSPYLYRFNSFNDAVDACHSISEMFFGYSRLYKYEGQIYLIILCTNGTEDCIDCNLLEYGDYIEESVLCEGALSEYGEVLIPKDAVQILYSYF